MSVRVIDQDQLPQTCSIAAAYYSDHSPAEILVRNEFAAARRAFSVLHEYAHHLVLQVEAVLEALFVERDGGNALEEDVCDAFASMILIPEDLQAEVFADGVTAAAVAELRRRSSGSREACAVAATSHLPAPGYVMLLDESATAVFAATGGDAFPVARLTQQSDSTLVEAARQRRGRGRTKVRFASGNLSPEMFFDAIALETVTIVVIVTDSPAWETLTAPPVRGAERQPGYCEACASEFQTAAAACTTCGELICTSCGECCCLPGMRATPGERKCQSCGYVLGPGAFASRTATHCRDCA